MQARRARSPPPPPPTNSPPSSFLRASRTRVAQTGIRGRSGEGGRRGSGAQSPPSRLRELRAWQSPLAAVSWQPGSKLAIPRAAGGLGHAALRECAPTALTPAPAPQLMRLRRCVRVPKATVTLAGWIWGKARGRKRRGSLAPALPWWPGTQMRGRSNRAALKTNRLPQSRTPIHCQIGGAGRRAGEGTWASGSSLLHVRDGPPAPPGSGLGAS